MSAKLHLLIGAPCSGKTTWAKKEHDAASETSRYYSSDDIRAELYGDASIQGNPQEIFTIMIKNTVNALKEGFEVYYDATNMTMKDRRGVLNAIPKDTYVVAHVFVCDPEELIQRDKVRERKVGADVINRMIGRFELPIEPYVDEIEVTNTARWSIELTKLLNNMTDYDQHNHWHTLTLDAHCNKAAKYITDCSKATPDYKVSSYLWDAACVHDIGKPYTQSGPDEKGDCHYYQHANWGAYLLLCTYDRVFAHKSVFRSHSFLFMVALVNFHMVPYDAQYFKSFKKRVPYDDLIDALTLLHEADEAAH